MEKEKLEEGLPKNNIIDSWLEEHGDPEICKRVERKLEKMILEKAAENYGWRIKTNGFSDPVKANELAESAKQDFIEGAKWMQEQMEKLKDFDTWKEWKNR